MDELKKVITILVERYKPIAIVLFGSRARGDHRPWSDYDILIIADFSEQYLRRISDVLEALSSINIPIEPHPYTLEEALKMIDKANPIIIDALTEGVILYKSK